jgi:type II secretory ATPase GspE/PulE/Tfp pilus assembly ATPase PilB-like protein
VRAGLTGHLVISTLHAGSCKGVFERLLIMCRDHYAVWSAVSLVLNQRLIRRSCRRCAGTGCANCLNTGYRGRAPIAECLRVDDALRRRVQNEGLDAVASKSPLAASARDLWQRGITTEQEFNRMFHP